MCPGFFVPGMDRPLNAKEPHAKEAHGSGAGRGQWTDIGDDTLAPYGNSDRSNAFRTVCM